MWWLILLSSVALIAIGVGLLVKDFRRGHASASGKSSALSAAVSGFETLGTNDPAVGSADDRPSQLTGLEPAQTVVTLPTPPPRLPAVEAYWQRLKPEITAATASLNQSLASLDMAIGPSGEATWSLHNRGYGDYRRIVVNSRSVAWLRIELCPDLNVSALVRAHDASAAAINHSVTIQRPFDVHALAVALGNCLARVIEAARHTQPPRPPQNNHAAAVVSAGDPHNSADARPAAWKGRRGRAAPPPPPPPAVTSSAVRAPATATMAPGSKRTRTLTGWGRAARPEVSASALVDTAVSVVNKAFVEAGARLELARDPIRHEPIGMDDRAFAIRVAGTSVGLMLIEALPDRIDISVGVSDVAYFAAARRVSLPLADLTIPVLAEAIATTAWPAIATALHTAA